MKEHPRLLNSEMVRATLEGRKTHTRQPMSTQPPTDEYCLCTLMSTTSRDDRKHEGKLHWQILDGLNVVECDDRYFKSPFGTVGDQLYVRESYVLHSRYDSLKASDCPDIKDLQNGVSCCVDIHNMEKSTWMGKTRPSIFMRKDFSRIQLDVLRVWVQRIRDISEEDAKAEGVQPAAPTIVKYRHSLGQPVGEYQVGFELLWDSIYGEGEFAWVNNPWVFGCEFRRIEK